MAAHEIVEEIRSLGIEGYKKILLNHGAKEPCLGVKDRGFEENQKRVKKDYQYVMNSFVIAVGSLRACVDRPCRRGRGKDWTRGGGHA